MTCDDVVCRVRRAVARPWARVRSEEGSVLLLMPAAVLIVVVLGGIAVDAAIVYLGERRAADLASSIANNAAALVDEEGFYERDEICLPQDVLQRYAHDRMVAASQDDRTFRVLVASHEDTGPPSSLTVVDSCLDAATEPRVEAHVRAVVPLIFSRALPGRDHVIVDATTRVRLTAP